MRKDIHPKYQALKIKIGKDEFLTASTALVLITASCGLTTYFSANP